MVTPDYKSFLQLSRDATLIPVARTLSADMMTPVGAFLSVAAKQKYSFLLESVEGGEKIGRYTFVGARSEHGADRAWPGADDSSRIERGTPYRRRQ